MAADGRTTSATESRGGGHERQPSPDQYDAVYYAHEDSIVLRWYTGGTA